MNTSKNQFISSNGHIVRQWGRGFFVVTSKSRNGLVHVVDLEEGPVCTCEAFSYDVDRPCRHCIASVESILEPLDLRGIELESALYRFFELLLAPKIEPLPDQKKGREYKLKAA